MYSVMGFETASAKEFASMKTIMWALITAIICYINVYAGGIMVLGIFSIYNKLGKSSQIEEYIKMLLMFISLPFFILGFMLMLSTFA